MIKTIDINNFRCFERLHIEGCRRINIIVGDNGAGKTSLLEAIFLALSGSPEVAVRFRQQRGIEGTYFQASAAIITEALWRDFFYRGEWDHPISIELAGDGPDTRAVVVGRGVSQLTIPLQPSQNEEVRSAPLVFQWRDAGGNIHVRTPQVTAQGLKIDGNEESLPDFFYFAANQPISSVEAAGRFSQLSRSNRVENFVKLFTEEYKWIEDINIEVVAGSPLLYATMRFTREKLALGNVSGGINRLFNLMLALASANSTVVLVDEVEDGIYHKHHQAMWRAMLSLARQNNGQIIATTHSEEWLGALFDAAGENVSDIALWRIERSENGQPIFRQFSGPQSSAAVKAGEVR